MFPLVAQFWPDINKEALKLITMKFCTPDLKFNRLKKSFLHHLLKERSFPNQSSPEESLLNQSSNNKSSKLQLSEKLKSLDQFTLNKKSEMLLLTTKTSSKTSQSQFQEDNLSERLTSNQLTPFNKKSSIYNTLLQL